MKGVPRKYAKGNVAGKNASRCLGNCAFPFVFFRGSPLSI
jgi:hypothetical protein